MSVNEEKLKEALEDIYIEVWRPNATLAQVKRMISLRVKEVLNECK